MMDIEKNQFSTKSLPLVAYLFAVSVSFHGIERIGGIVYFHFSDCDAQIQEYYADGLVVAAHYWSGLQRAKDLIFDQKRTRY